VDAALLDAQIAFHGTSRAGIPAILCGGWDPARRAGQAYGPGEYFGATPNVPFGYVKDGETQMIVAGILPNAPRTDHHGGEIVVVNNPPDNPTTQYVVPLGVVIFADQAECSAELRCLRPRAAIPGNIAQLENDLHAALAPNGRFPVSDTVVEEMLRRVEREYNLEVPTPRQLRDIATALGLNAGHAFRCRSCRYMYFIGECGGAMERGKCPNCGGGIGGVQHAIDNSSEFAGHLFEPSARPNWPGQH